MQIAVGQISPIESSLRSPLGCWVVHAIPGRLRLRMESWRLFVDLAMAFETFLRDLPGIQDVRLNPSCRSVTLTYDPTLSSAEALLARVQALSLDELALFPVHSRPGYAGDSDSLPWLPLGLSSAAVALGALAESALAPWFLLGAAVPIFRRAYEVLTQKGTLNVDVLDATATTVLTLNGQAFTAALMVWFISLGDFLHDLNRQQARRAITEVKDERTRAIWAGQFARDSSVHETRLQSDAEQLADRTTPWSLVGASVALIMGSEDLAAALLIADYGTGMRVAAPITVLASMTRAAVQGIFVQRGRTLEQLAEVDALVFEKAGVLTQGTPEIVEVIPYGKKNSPERILAFAAAAEKHLTHPVADAIVRAAQDREVEISEHEAAEFRLGLGVEAVIDGAVVLVGSQRFMTQKGVPLQRARKDLRALAGRTASPLFIAVDGKLIGLLVAVDPLCPEAHEIFLSLREQRVKEIVMLTGDHPAVAETVAKQLGISRYLADAFPEQKSDFIRSLQQEGRRVAVVTNGRTPSLALAQADVGIAIDSGADIAQKTVQVAVLEGDLWRIPQVIGIARESVQLLQQNWNLTFYLNTTAVALALPGLLGPLGATLLNNGSAVLAVLNALQPMLAGGSGRTEHVVRT